MPWVSAEKPKQSLEKRIEDSIAKQYGIDLTQKLGLKMQNFIQKVPQGKLNKSVNDQVRPRHNISAYEDRRVRPQRNRSASGNRHQMSTFEDARKQSFSPQNLKAAGSRSKVRFEETKHTTSINFYKP